MDWYRLLRSQVIPLPEDIAKKKWAGDYDGAMAAIDAKLMAALPEGLRDRLLIEKELLPRLRGQRMIGKKEALSIIREKLPGFSEAEFDRYEAEGGIDFLSIDGEKRYYRYVWSMLLDWDRSLIERSGGKLSGNRPVLDEAIAEIRKKGRLGYRIRVRVQLSIEDSAFVPGETYRVHLPVPAACPQQSNIRIFADPDGCVSDENHPQRTVFYERRLSENAPFTVEYEYDNTIVSMASDARPLYPAAAPPTVEDLLEIPPHLQFTPYLKRLAAELMEGKTEPLDAARAFYDYVTRQVTYSYLRDYLLVDNVAEYAAVNRKGDCGAQALLFMALCRIAGIPARWQSCANASPDTTGSHDWCWFHVEPYGWIPCDPSRGGGAYQSGALERWAFYFGHLDPYRMVANRAYMVAFDPPKRHLRNDPYDSQSGEAETDTRGMLPGEIHTERTLVSLQKL